MCSCFHIKIVKAAISRWEWQRRENWLVVHFCSSLRKILKFLKMVRRGLHCYIIQTVKRPGIFGQWYCWTNVSQRYYDCRLLSTCHQRAFTPILQGLGVISRPWVFRRIWCNCIATHIVVDVLNKKYHLVLSNRFPAYFEYGLSSIAFSLHLNPCDFFLWDFLKNTVYGNNSP